MSGKNSFLQRIDIFAILTVVLPLQIYLMTLAPSVTFFDSGEFITAIYSLGSAHSPGYPLFINYAKPFTYLPFGNIAFRVNIATAVSAAAACYGVYLLTCHFLATEEMIKEKRLSVFYRRVIPLSAALIFAFSARLWLQSNHDKPYPLIAFLSAIILYLILLWRDRYAENEEHNAYIYLGAFIWGLAFGAHQTMVLLIPSFAFLILIKDWRLIRRIREMALIAAFGLVGFSIHLHLPVRAMRSPLLNWGDPRTLTQFLWHFLRKGYPVEKPERGISLFWTQLQAFNIPREFTPLGLALLFLGIYAFRKKLRDEILAYVIGVVFFLSVIIGYLNTQPDFIFLTEEFFTPLYLFTAVLIGLGSFAFLKIWCDWAEEKTGPFLLTAAASLFLAALPFTLCALNYRVNDQHENYIAYDYSSNTLRTLPERAVLFTWGDSGAFPLWYLQGVERMREDVPLLHTPHLVFPWYLDSFPELFRNSLLRAVTLDGQPLDNVLKMAISEQIDNRPVYIDFSTRYSVSFDDLIFQQRGICYHLERGTSGTLLVPDLSVWNLYTLRGIYGGMFFRDLDTIKAIQIYAFSHMEAGETLLSLGKRNEGVEQLGDAEKIVPELRQQIVKVLGANGVK